MTETNTTTDGSTEVPQIYLITPPQIELSSFPASLARILDAREIACVRLALSSSDEDEISRAADLLRETCHARDIPLIIDTHVKLMERLGLDGVHLQDGARSVRYARKELGADAALGAYVGASRHEGMNAGESGADYVAMGPASETGLGTEEAVALDDITWWSQMIELPIVVEGAVSVEAVERFAPVTDFFGIGPEIWSAEDPLAALNALLAPLG